MSRPPAAGSPPPRPHRRRGPIALLALALALAAPLAGAPQAEDEPQPSPPRDAFAAWLEEVEPLITESEREAFAGLTRDYQSGCSSPASGRFATRFPRPRRTSFATPGSAGWSSPGGALAGSAGSAPGPCCSPGRPTASSTGSAPICCGRPRSGSTAARRGCRGASPWSSCGRGADYRAWSPVEGLRELLDIVTGASSSTSAAIQRLQTECGGRDDVAGLLLAAVDWKTLSEQWPLVPQPELGMGGRLCRPHDRRCRPAPTRSPPSSSTTSRAGARAAPSCRA